MATIESGMSDVSLFMKDKVYELQLIDKYRQSGDLIFIHKLMKE